MTLLQQNGFFLRSPKDNKLYGKIDSLKPWGWKERTRKCCNDNRSCFYCIMSTGQVVVSHLLGTQGVFCIFRAQFLHQAKYMTPKPLDHLIPGKSHHTNYN